MSLQSVAASAARAAKAQQANAKAARGDIVLVPTVHSATLKHGPTTRTQAFALGMVTSVTRDGLVKAYAYYSEFAPRYWAGLDGKHKATSGHYNGCTIASASVFARPVREIIEALPHEFPSIDAARDALRPFVKV
jgi:hypothetical protein